MAKKPAIFEIKADILDDDGTVLDTVREKVEAEMDNIEQAMAIFSDRRKAEGRKFHITDIFYDPFQL